MSVKEIIRLSCDSEPCEYKCDYANRRVMNGATERTLWISNAFGDFCSGICWDRYRQENNITDEER